MVHIICDRCGKDVLEVFRRSPYDKIQKLKPGDYAGSIMKVEESDSPLLEENDEIYRNDYLTLDLCDDCDKEFNELISKFMKHP